MNKNILLIQFSGREDGNCAAIAAYIQQQLSEDNVLSKSINHNTMPSCGDCNYECLRLESKCPRLTNDQSNIFESVCNADLVFYIIPNYCGFPCANYYAFNERSVGYFNLDKVLMQKYMSVKKRFIIVSNSEGPNFENAMMQQCTDPEIIYIKSSKYGKKSIAGDILDSDEAKADIKAFLGLETVV